MVKTINKPATSIKPNQAYFIVFVNLKNGVEPNKWIEAGVSAPLGKGIRLGLNHKNDGATKVNEYHKFLSRKKKIISEILSSY